MVILNAAAGWAYSNTTTAATAATTGWTQGNTTTTDITIPTPLYMGNNPPIYVGDYYICSDQGPNVDKQVEIVKKREPFSVPDYDNYEEGEEE
jgi:hypothetical protein